MSKKFLEAIETRKIIENYFSNNFYYRSDNRMFIYFKHKYNGYNVNVDGFLEHIDEHKYKLSERELISYYKSNIQFLTLLHPEYIDLISLNVGSYLDSLKWIYIGFKYNNNNNNRVVIHNYISMCFNDLHLIFCSDIKSIYEGDNNENYIEFLVCYKDKYGPFSEISNYVIFTEISSNIKNFLNLNINFIISDIFIENVETHEDISNYFKFDYFFKYYSFLGIKNVYSCDLCFNFYKFNLEHLNYYVFICEFSKINNIFVDFETIKHIISILPVDYQTWLNYFCKVNNISYSNQIVLPDNIPKIYMYTINKLLEKLSRYYSYIPPNYNILFSRKLLDSFLLMR